MPGWLNNRIVGYMYAYVLESWMINVFVLQNKWAYPRDLYKWGRIFFLYQLIDQTLILHWWEVWTNMDMEFYKPYI